MLHVARSRLAEARLDRGAEDVVERRHEVEQAGPPSARDVEDFAADARRIGRPEIGVDDVGYVREVARLGAIPVNLGRFAPAHRRDELRADRGVLRGGVLARPKDVEVPQTDRLEAEQAREYPAVVLTGQLGYGIGRQRVGRQVLTFR